MKLTRHHKPDGGALARFGQTGAWSPLSELARLQNEISQVFQSPFEDFLAPAGLLEGWIPAVDLYDEKDKFTVKMELPGMKKEDIEVSVDGNTLTISGERKQEEEQRGAETYRVERFFGRFQRSLILPQPVDPNRISATYQDGVLTIALPKTEEAKRKQIEVKNP